MFKKRTLRMQFKNGGRTFINRACVSRRIMASGIEDAVWFAGMAAKCGRPALCDGVRATEQTRVRSDTRQPS